MTDRQINELSLNELLDADSLVLQTAGGQTVRTTGAQLKEFVIESVPDDVEIDGQPLNTIQSVVFDTGNVGLKTVAFSEIRSHILAQKATTTTFGTSKKASTGAINNPSFFSGVEDHYVNPLQLEEKLSSVIPQQSETSFERAQYTWIANKSSYSTSDISMTANNNVSQRYLFTQGNGLSQGGTTLKVLPDFNSVGSSAKVILIGIQWELTRQARIDEEGYSRIDFALTLDQSRFNGSVEKPLAEGSVYIWGHEASGRVIKVGKARNYSEVWIPIRRDSNDNNFSATLTTSNSNSGADNIDTDLDIRISLQGFASTQRDNT